MALAPGDNCVRSLSILAPPVCDGASNGTPEQGGNSIQNWAKINL